MIYRPNWAPHFRKFDSEFSPSINKLRFNCRSLASQIKSPVPVLETEVHSTIKAFRADLKALMDRLAISSSTTVRPVNNSPITSTARPAMETSTGFPMTKPATTTTRVPTVGKNAVNSSLTDKLIVIDSLATAIDNPNAVVLLTGIFQMVKCSFSGYRREFYI
jgi:hypothetical protein